MGLIMLAVFAFQIYRMADRKGVKPWPYVLNYISIFVVSVFVLSISMVMILGIDVEHFDQAKVNEMATSVLPFVLLFEVMLFIYFFWRINKLHDYEDEDDNQTPQPPKEKKDLSYFR